MRVNEFITWIHLSDYHAGQRGAAARPQIEEVFERSVKQMAERLGVPDLLLFTGDLAYSGKSREYERVDALLDRINSWLDVELPVFAVPGNHDLARPTKMSDKLKYSSLARHEDDELVRAVLWQDKPGFLRPLFREYDKWSQRTMLARIRRAKHDVHCSARAPGDYSAIIEKHGLRLGIVGLNSSWMQVDDGDYEEKLQLPTEQFLAALPPGSQPLDWFRRVNASLLLTHHPPSWLSPRARRSFERDIFPPGRFRLWLCGHMHEPETRSESRDGTAARIVFQAPSLFGLEGYGSSRESRSFGYAWGRIASSGEIRVWPKIVVQRGGSSMFVDDPKFEPATDSLGGFVAVPPRVSVEREPPGHVDVKTDIVVDPRSGIEMVYIPGGSFFMGTREDEAGDDDERKQHFVELAGFYLARTPVTNAQYARFLAAEKTAGVPSYWNDPRFNQPEQPVVGVTWIDAEAYCTWAGLILPTEAQWEYAARARQTTRYWSGDKEQDLARVGWYDRNSGGRPRPVGELPANSFGLHDVHGNVWEWCRDNFGGYETPPQPGDGLRHAPTGTKTNRVLRGGGWPSLAFHARSAYRNYALANRSSHSAGFRPAKIIR